MTKCTIQRQQGFTLLEMSIVLTIIGLIVGAIFVGDTMIRAAQVNGVINEVTRYTQAITGFKDKYLAYPGDLSTAESYWGADTSCPGTPNTTVPHVATCNGNGDGYIGYQDATAGWTSSVNYEMFRAWQQLGNAGFIETSYTGTYTGSSSPASVPGVNVPASKVPGGGYSVFFYGAPAGQANTMWPVLGHVIALGAAVSGDYTYGPLLTPGEAFGLDTKMDDGVPSTGNVMTLMQPFVPNCITTNVASTTAYNANYSSRACNLIFVMGF